MIPIEHVQGGCRQCSTRLPFEFTFAFQPIVNLHRQTIFGYEALVRGSQGESAFSILNQLTDQNR